MQKKLEAVSFLSMFIPTEERNHRTARDEECSAQVLKQFFLGLFLDCGRILWGTNLSFEFAEGLVQGKDIHPFGYCVYILFLFMHSRNFCKVIINCSFLCQI